MNVWQVWRLGGADTVAMIARGAMRRGFAAARARSLAWWLRAALVAVALLGVALAMTVRALGGPADGPQRLLGKPAPTFALPAERGGQMLGEPVSLEAHRGHPVLLVFFYTLCTHCLGQLQMARDVGASEARRGLEVLYVDSPGERPSIPADYAARVGIDAPILLDANAAVAGCYGIRYYPTLLLLDAGGTVRGAWTGETDSATLAATIRRLDER